MDSVHPLLKERARQTGEEHQPPNNRPKRGHRALKWTLGIIVVIILALGVILLARAVHLSNQIFVGNKTSFFKQISRLLQGTTAEARLIGEDTGQINLLVLGIGGEGHDGPYLSDTIMVVQIRPDDKKVSIISIPRDYYAAINGLGFRKINNAFAEGFARRKDYNEAGKLARETVEKVSGLTIPYFAVVDFNGFKEAIDQIGGIDMHIDRTFTDYSFPNEKNGYLPPITFTAGNEHMDGERALTYARSRHAAGQEGGDFARAQRQQKVLQAVKEKVLSLNLITDASKINSLLSVLGSHFHTNLRPAEMFHLYNLAKDYSKENILTASLDPDTNLVCNSITEDGAYVLSLCPGKTAVDIQNFFDNSFNRVGPTQSGVVWLADTTKVAANSRQVEQKLTQAGFTVYRFTFSGPTLQQTLVYEVNPLAGAADFIKKELNATQVTLPPPGLKVSKDKVDLVVILGGATTQ